jgi:hypothetical protein
LKELWRRTWDLLWRSPLLWLPALAADAIGFALLHGQQLLSHRILQWLVRSAPGSVLGSTPETSALSTVQVKAVLFTAPLLWLTYFLTVLLFGFALATTAALVRDARGGRSLDFGRGFGWALSRTSQVGVLVGGIFSVLLPLGALMVWTLSRFTEALPTQAGALMEMLLVYGIVACVFTPAALRVVRPDGTTPRSSIVRRARALALLAVVATVAVAGGCLAAQTGLNAIGSLEHGFARSLAEATASLLTALPYPPLFVALSLAAGDESAPASAIAQPERKATASRTTQ